MAAKDAETALKEVLAVLEKKNVARECVRCRQNKWSGNFIAVWVSPMPNAGAISIPPPRQPMFALTCTNCGWTAYHNLMALGVDV